MNFLSELRFALKPSGDIQTEEKRLEHTTRAVFAIIGLSLLISTVAVAVLDLTAQAPAIWPLFLMLGMNILHAAAWTLIGKGGWRIARLFPPAIFLISGFILSTQPELITLAILQFALGIILTANLFSATTQWITVFLSSLAFLLATQTYAQEQGYIFASVRYIVIVIFGAIAILLQISSSIIAFTMQGLRRETESRKTSELTALQNAKLLSVVAQSAQMLVETADWKTKINDVLSLLGEAAQASHAYLFENHFDEHGAEVSSLKYQWSNTNCETADDISDFQNVPLKHASMMDWYETLSAGKPYYDSTKAFPEEWKGKKSQHQIKTLLDVPIFIDGVWWGIIGFDDCARVKPWSQVEVDAMKIAAGLLGALIKRQKADEEIKASEEKFQTTFHESLIPMVIGRLSDRLILEVNPAFTTLTGFSREEAVNHYPNDLNIWASQVEREKHREILQQKGHLREFKAHLRKKSGEIAVVALSVAKIKVKMEDCLLYTLYEITQLENALNELQDKNNELERFTYTVSHDLKAPLITIGGFAGLLARDLKSGNAAKAQRSVERILDAVNKMERLLNELLSLSRIGRMINEPQEVAFEEIAKEAVGLAQGRLRANNIPVEIEANLPVVKVDRVRIVEALQNLIDNAAKFMGAQKNPKIKIGVKRENNAVIFFVSDNGIGIDPAYHERVFGLFNKLDSTSEGTGVGLALVKRIIEFHGGKVWVESEGANKGSTFYFTLPTL